jgi:hypothetical protein
VLDLPGRRRELAALFAWAIPDEGALAVLARHPPAVDRGRDRERHRRGAGGPGVGADAVPVLAPFDDDGASYAALRAYQGDIFVYAGGGTWRADRYRALPPGA